MTHTIICVIIALQEGDTEKGGNIVLKTYSSREVIEILIQDGWYEVRVNGSHHQFKHPVKKGTTTVKHPDKDIPRKTLDSIERQSGLKFR